VPWITTAHICVLSRLNNKKHLTNGRREVLSLPNQPVNHAAIRASTDKQLLMMWVPGQCWVVKKMHSLVHQYTWNKQW
jgi:hypothetical protein